MRYCKKAPRSSPVRRKSIKCKYGYLKRPVRDKETGKMRYCKKGPVKKKSRRKSRVYKKRPRKQIEIKYSPNKNINKGCVERSALSLRPHQKHVVKYLDKHKGILAIHGTGTGKTLTAVTASQCFLDANPDKKVIVVSPAALVHNFAKELGKYRNVKHAKKYEFYSYERFLNKMYENGLKEKNKNKVIEDYKDINLYKPINLKGNLLIVDEAHNLRNTKSKKTIAVTLASYSAAKRILLSATPVVNNISDLIPIINMINGKKVVGTCKEMQQGKVKYCIKNITSRNNNISKETKKAIEKLLKNRIDIVDLNLKSSDFPKMRQHKMKVTMTNKFYQDYDKLLKEEELNDIVFNNPRAFYNGYRRAVNSVGVKKGVNYYSMKINKSIPIIKKGKTIIYTNWLSFGVNPITNALKTNNIPYRVVSGSVSQKERIKTVKEFNENKVKTLIITKAGGEGLDLKEVRNVIVVDPPWNPANLDQIIGRAVRFRSHANLPAKDRFVDIYYMELQVPDNIKKVYGSEATKTGDQLLYKIILRKNRLLDAINNIFEKIQIKK